MKYFLLIFIVLLNLNIANAAEKGSFSLPKHDWSFNGFFGTFDKSSIQRGFKVYREVCAGCHSMNLLYYRDLLDVGFSEDEVKAIASEYTVLDGPNDEGEMFERPGKPSDRFVPPFANDQQARAYNNGSYPPDLSVIVKARKYGADYLYYLLLGYEDPPEGFELGDGMYYNKWKEGNQIAMSAPLGDGYVDYDDGTDNNLSQLSEDIVTFLAWSAEPELEIRKNLGVKVIIFFLILGFLFYLIKIRLWKDIN